MSKPKPISITMNYFEGEMPDAKAIRFIETTLDSFLQDDNNAKRRVLDYISRKLYETQDFGLQPLGELVEPKAKEDES